MTCDSSSRSYDLNGVAITVEGDPGQIRFLDPILEPLTRPDRTPDAWIVKLTAVDEVESPAQMSRVIWEGKLPEQLESVFSEHDGRRTLFVAQHYKMTVDAATKSSTVAFTPDGRGSIGGTGAFWLLGELLAAADRFLVHAACLIEPRSDTAFVLFAPSGTGKTTTSLTFARHGLALAGDDALVVECSGDGSHVWSIPRGMKVDQRTAAMLPWLAPVLREWVSEEQVIDRARLEGIVALASPRRRNCAAVIVLNKPNPIAHEIEFISRADAATHIFSDNLRKFPGGVDAHGRATFAAVARLLAGTVTLSLSMGPNPDSFEGTMILDKIHSIAANREQG